jgi:hypothetical protein
MKFIISVIGPAGFRYYVNDSGMLGVGEASAKRFDTEDSAWAFTKERQQFWGSTIINVLGVPQ